MKLNSQKEVRLRHYDSSGINLIKPGYLIPHRICFPTHWHECMEVIFMTSGTLHYKIRDYETILVKDQLAIIPPEEPHSGIAGDEGCSYETIQFELPRFCNTLPITEQILKPIMEHKMSFEPVTTHPDIVATIKTIFTFSEKPSSYLLRLGKIYELLALICEHCLVENSVYTSSIHHFQPILDYINEHFCENISSATISQKFGYSEAYFCRQFKLVTGLSPSNYIRILRLEKAAKLMNEFPSYSIGEIATQCGFSDTTYFTRCFKEQYRSTPTAYVKK